MTIQLQPVEQRILEIIQDVPTVQRAHPREPDAWLMQDMPIVWFRWIGPERIVDFETGGGQEVTHAWLVEIVVDAGVNIEEAQTQLQEVTQAVVSALRADPTLNDLVDNIEMLLERPADFFQREPSDALFYGLQLRLRAIRDED